MKLAIGMVALVLIACGDRKPDVKSAKGETTVKYVICGPAESNCFVAARFQDLEQCQSHKDWSDMYCDKRSSPGVMVCKQGIEPSFGVSYCVP